MNESLLDRAIRIVIGAACLLIAAYVCLPVIFTAILTIAGIYLVISGLTGNDVIYWILGRKTR